MCYVSLKKNFFSDSAIYSMKSGDNNQFQNNKKLVLLFFLFYDQEAVNKYQVINFKSP